MFTNKRQALYLEVVNYNMFMHNKKKPLKLNKIFWDVEFECKTNFGMFSPIELNHKANPFIIIPTWNFIHHISKTQDVMPF
jgi:hypothetical protein